MRGHVVCFGELLLRLAAPGRQLLLQSMPGAPASLAVAQLANKIKALLVSGG